MKFTPFKIIVTFTVLIIFSILLIYATKMEYSDLFCSTNKGKQICKSGNGVAYREGKPSPNDSVDVLLQKISYSSIYETNSVKWRRCLILSVVITLVLFFLLFSRLPTGREFLICVLIIYFTMYLMLSFYQSQVAKYAVKQILTSIKYINDIKSNLT